MRPEAEHCRFYKRRSKIVHLETVQSRQWVFQKIITITSSP